MGMQLKKIGRYAWTLLQGLGIMLLLLTWNLQWTAHGWRLPLTWFTAWVGLSWLLGYPFLRQHFSSLYHQNGSDMESYKNRALRLHQADIASHHTDRRWTSNGVAANPWSYGATATQTTDEILNPIYLFCAHLWATFLLILFGPVLVVGVFLTAAVKHWH